MGNRKSIVRNPTHDTHIDAVTSVNTSNTNTDPENECFPKVSFSIPSWVKRMACRWKAIEGTNHPQNLDPHEHKEENIGEHFADDHALIVPVDEVLPDDQIIDGLNGLHDFEHLIDEAKQSLTTDEDQNSEKYHESLQLQYVHDDSLIKSRMIPDKMNNVNDQNDHNSKNSESIDSRSSDSQSTNLEPVSMHVYRSDLEINDTMHRSALIQDKHTREESVKMQKINTEIAGNNVIEHVLNESSIMQQDFTTNQQIISIAPIKRLQSKTDPIVFESTSPRSSDIDEKYKSVYENLRVIRSIKPNEKLRVSSTGELSIDQSYLPSVTRILTGNSKIITVQRIDETLKVARQLKKIPPIKQMLDDQLAVGLRNLAITYASDEASRNKLESLASSV